MLFRYPQVLYALFLLLIPIIVHLFQLRRFKKTYFTNVAFLQRVDQSTRKSSQIKKWLILATRLLALAAVVLAFAQPYFPNTNKATKPSELVIFVDNSFSMQAKGEKGPLLSQAVQEIIANIPNEQVFSILTYNDVLRKIDVETSQNELLDINYSPVTIDEEALALQLKNLFSKSAETSKELILVSDFQGFDTATFSQMEDVEQHWVKLQPEVTTNLAIDSLAIQPRASDYQVNVYVKSNAPIENTVALSLYNGEKLVGKAAANFDNTSTATTTFTITVEEGFKGRITLNDPNLLFDNDFFFSINKPEPLKVLGINTAEGDFLSRIYLAPEFDYQAVDYNALDYGIISNQNVVILNEPETVEPALVNLLTAFANNGGIVVLIPSSTSSAQNYNELLGAFGLMPFGESRTGTKRVTGINYDHPLYNNVFSRRVDNLKFHTVENTFTWQASDVILSLEDGGAFLAENNGLYVFAGAIDKENSNFINGQLIVPTFYKMGIAALSLPQSYYTLGQNNNFEVPLINNADAAVSLVNGSHNIIPRQERQGDKVRIFTGDGIPEAGIYTITSTNDSIATVAFNYDRSESNLVDQTLQPSDNITVTDSIEKTMDTLKAQTGVHNLYKWFIIFAIAMLVMEMLILKFLK
ncbi:MAG: hypothetical protein CL868_20490 [Cytophagaceae bacterium]|nr:hypothetical protein [Cytophagaceae bacterium]